LAGLHFGRFFSQTHLVTLLSAKLREVRFPRFFVASFKKLSQSQKTVSEKTNGRL
jgi:hypothetical protein